MRGRAPFVDTGRRVPYIARRSSVPPPLLRAPPSRASSAPRPDEPVRVEGNEDPGPRQAGEGTEHRGARRTAQAGADLPHPAGPEDGYAHHRGWRARGAAGWLRLLAQPGLLLHARAGRHLRVALPDPPLQP